MAFRNNPPKIALEDLIWDEIGGQPEDDDEERIDGEENEVRDHPRSRLLAHIQIGTLDMHLEAVEVYYDGDGAHHAVYPGREQDLLDLMHMEDTDFRTMTIDGREYVLYATPYGD